MHIGMILDRKKGFPPDIRVEKEIKSLLKDGHKITILSHFVLGVHKSYIQKYKSDKAIIIRKCIPNESNLNKIKFGICLINNCWLPAINEFISKEQPDVLHVHDFKILPTVNYVNRKYNLPIVADLHENIPASFVARRTSLSYSKKAIQYIFKNYWIWKFHERKQLKKCSKIIVVVPEAIKRLKEYAIDSDKITVVSNTEDNTTYSFNESEYDRDIMKQYKDDWMVSYIGGIGPHRGIDTAINAVSILKGKIKNLKLVIVGLKPEQKDKLQNVIKTTRNEKFIDLIEWQPSIRAKSYMFSSKVCLVPHNKFEHTDTTVPHKLFQAMILKKPLLVSDVKPLKRIVSECNCGLIFKANSSEDFAEKLIEMYNNPQNLISLAKNGHDAALGKYSWKHDETRLRNIYLEIENDNRN